MQPLLHGAHEYGAWHAVLGGEEPVRERTSDIDNDAERADWQHTALVGETDVEDEEDEDDVPSDDEEEEEVVIPLDEEHDPVAPALIKPLWMVDAEGSPLAEQAPAYTVPCCPPKVPEHLIVLHPEEHDTRE